VIIIIILTARKAVNKKLEQACLFCVHIIIIEDIAGKNSASSDESSRDVRVWHVISI